jgi:hypothetical protein
VAAARGITGIDGRRRLNEAGERAVEATADVVAAHVDRVLGRRPRGDAG